MQRLPYILIIMALSLAAIGCKRTPSYVLDKNEMAELIADLYVGESVVDMNHNDFNTDSSRLLLRQSILAKHGVTQEQYDTSMVWYGHNFDKYMDVYDRTIEILEERNQALGNAILQTAVSLSGDSVDVWPGARYARINKRMPSRLVEFDITSDENWERGDIYTWRLKLIDEGARSMRWTMLATYSDSTCDWYTYSSSYDAWNEIVFPSDSIKTLTSLKGYFEVLPGSAINDGKNKSEDLWIDSISLIRKRFNPEMYYQRSRMRTYHLY